MNPLLAILAHSGASEALKRHWPYYERAGLPILGVDREDTKTVWPAQPSQRNLWRTISIGKEGYAQGTNHLDRYLEVLRLFIFDTDHSHLVVCEWDGIWLKPCPPLGSGFTATIAGHRSQGFMAENYFHTPWICDRETAETILRVGPIIIAHGLTEKGFLDRWLGLLVGMYSIPFTNAAAFCYSQNTLDRPEFIEGARKAVQEGCAYVHGVKSADILEQLTKGLI